MPPLVIPINGVIGWDFTSADLRKALAEADGGPIELQVNSPGGIVFDGLEMYNIIREYPGDSSAVTMGVAASMASILPLAAKKTKGYTNSVGMIHEAWGIAIGNADDMAKEGEILSGLSSILAEIYAQKTGKSVDEIKAAMKSETWLFGSELLDFGLIDEIMDAPEESTAKDKPAAMASARLARANAERIVREFDGGDRSERVALLVETMKPRATITKQTPAVGGAGKPAENIPGGKPKMNTLEELKTQAPTLYAAAKQEGVEAERDRVAKINRFAVNGPGAAKVAAEAVASGKSFDEVMPELVAASARPAGGQENAPSVATSTVTVAALSAEDLAAAEMMNLSPEEYRKYMPKKEGN